MSKANDDIVKVQTRGGDIPFSVGYLSDALLSIGLPQEQAYNDSYSISLIVAGQGKSLLTSEEIMKITANWYEGRDPELSGRIMIMFNDFEELKPMVILLGGVTGIGKSTLSQLLGSRMKIKSLIGTDLIREVMRVTISPTLMPSLHTSSYIAYKKMDTSFLPALSQPIVGFEEQARSVVVGVEAAIEQAIDDNEILIIEGVHLVPGLIKKKIMKKEAVIEFQLILKDEEVHRSRLKRRESKKTLRATQYSKHIDEIREIQEYLIEQANTNNVKLINVDDDEEALQEMINYIWESRIIKID
ncbi:MAG: 2-phosphoglycerate kinase [Candidatus Heimdallarchaeota archaeon LC_2]|nr:MAG: 2-phosphoglycerate kinase [Candidatus Heimdallarchaeota archaeon LC_2]